MPDEIDHERWRRFAAHYQPMHQLAQPYLDAVGRMEKAEAALRAICEIAAEPGEAGAMKALKEAQRIAAEALPAGPNVIPFPK